MARVCFKERKTEAIQVAKVVYVKGKKKRGKPK